MQALHYPPHFTFVIYEDNPPAHLYDTFDLVFAQLKPILLRFDALNYFNAANGYVLWASAQIPKELLAIHQLIHENINPELCYPHYRPDAWRPHCSLATQIPADKKDAVLAITSQNIEPFEVLFDVADCVSFLPVVIVKQKPLC